MTALGSATVALPALVSFALAGACIDQDPPEAPSPSKPLVEIVFALDTTGSMGSLIADAKERIWRIANEIATFEPTPEVRMGLVAYRDRGDDYVTRRTPLTSDLDRVHTALMGLEAKGGGDREESVNQALHEAVTDMEWSAGRQALRIVYLVGDSPPHSDYADDVPYVESCALAAQRGIVINTLRCGDHAETREVWQEIARAAEGSAFDVPVRNGVRRETPFDADLADLGQHLEWLRVPYGSDAERDESRARRTAARKARARNSRSALAERAVFRASAAAALGSAEEKDLVSDVLAGRVRVEDVAAEHLPESLRALSPVERSRRVGLRTQQRRRVEAEIGDLRIARARWEEANPDAGGVAFDRRVVRALREQAARAGLRIPEVPGSVDPEAAEPGS